MRYYSEVATPIGPVTIVSDGTAIIEVSMRPAVEIVSRAVGVRGVANEEWIEDGDVLSAAREQLEAYFAGDRREFTLPLAAQGTPFQKRVWSALCDIPYGVTASYGEIASVIGMKGSARAVGAANGANPIGIVVPCHRVIGANGTLTGYGGGIERKKYLLELEAGVVSGSRQMRLAV